MTQIRFPKPGDPRVEPRPHPASPPTEHEWAWWETVKNRHRRRVLLQCALGGLPTGAAIVLGSKWVRAALLTPIRGWIAVAASVLVASAMFGAAVFLSRWGPGQHGIAERAIREERLRQFLLAPPDPE